MDLRFGSATDSHLNTELLGQETEDGEDAESGKDRGQTVAETHDHRVAEHVVVERIVRGQSDEPAAGHGEREEDLDGRARPHRDVGEPRPVGDDVEADAVDGAGEGGGLDEQNDEDEVGEGGGEVDDLAGALDALDEAEEDDDPGGEEAAREVALHAAHVLQAVLRLVQHVLLEVLLSG